MATFTRSTAKKIEEHREELLRWLLTYADMITLLMLFFIILYSMSSINQEKYKELSQALESVFTGRPMTVIESTYTSGAQGFMQNRGQYQPQRSKRGKQSKLYMQLTSSLKQFVSAGQARIISNESGLIITIGSDLFFNTGSADIQPDALPFMEKLAPLLNSINNNIRIEGHTDNVPLKSKKFSSNWELSAQRAINILKSMADYGVPMERMSAVAYGSSKPFIDNDTPENRAMNRRVDIVIIMNEE